MQPLHIISLVDSLSTIACLLSPLFPSSLNIHLLSLSQLPYIYNPSFLALSALYPSSHCSCPIHLLHPHSLTPFLGPYPLLCLFQAWFTSSHVFSASVPVVLYGLALQPITADTCDALYHLIALSLSGSVCPHYSTHPLSVHWWIHSALHSPSSHQFSVTNTLVRCHHTFQLSATPPIETCCWAPCSILLLRCTGALVPSHLFRTPLTYQLVT